MSKFYIYTKDDKFHLTDVKIGLFIFSSFIPALIHLLFFSHFEFTKFEIFIVFVGIASSIISYFFQLASFFRYKPLDGKIEGEIELKEMEIIIRNVKIKTEEIKNIEITNDDFFGFKDRSMRLIFIGRKSNGVNNEIRITLFNNKVFKINYQQDNHHDMQDSKELLENYYSKGIITIENLLYVLGIVNEDEKNEYKRTLEKRNTTANKC